MAITAAMVKELREMTGAGMMDCKKALNEVDGDMDKAVEFLREKGLAAAAKKASRIAAEGIVATLVSDDKKSAAIVEVNAETDFVAKNEVFQSYVARVAAQVLASNNTTMEAFMAEPWIDDASFTVEQELSQMVAKIGEKLSIRRFEKVTNENGVIASYDEFADTALVAHRVTALALGLFFTLKALVLDRDAICDRPATIHQSIDNAL